MPRLMAPSGLKIRVMARRRTKSSTIFWTGETSDAKAYGTIAIEDSGIGMTKDDGQNEHGLNLIYY